MAMLAKACYCHQVFAGLILADLISFPLKRYHISFKKLFKIVFLEVIQNKGRL